MHHQNYEYAAMVNSLDENVGRIIAKIGELGIAENTVIIFSLTTAVILTSTIKRPSLTTTLCAPARGHYMKAIPVHR